MIMQIAIKKALDIKIEKGRGLNSPPKKY